MTEEKTVLVVEDEKNIVDILRFNLERKGYRVIEAYDGEEGLRMARTEKPDLILLDIMLPKMIGFDVCGALRKDGDNVPILLLTAREEEDDKVRGLEIGADDYITKPFEIEELLARLRLIFRKWSTSRSKVYELDYLKVDLTAHTTEVAGKTVNLTQREFALLSYFLEHRGIVVSRADILDDVWGMDFDGQENTVDAYVRYLRAKIDLPNHKSLIETVRGVGYRLNGEG